MTFLIVLGNFPNLKLSCFARKPDEARNPNDIRNPNGGRKPSMTRKTICARNGKLKLGKITKPNGLFSGPIKRRGLWNFGPSPYYASLMDF